MPTNPPRKPSTKAKVAARQKRSSASKKQASGARIASRRRGATEGEAPRSAALPEAGGLVQELELDRATSGGDTRALPRASASPSPVSALSRGAVRRRDVTVFLRQLIMMLESGTPILKGLKTLAHRSEQKGVRQLVGGIAEYVESGNPLWQAFAREGRYFQPVEVNLIKAAEASGTLPAVLRRIADFREQRDRQERRVQVAMIYPAFLVVVATALVVILSMFVIPAFREIFDSMGVELNSYSAFIMNTADLVRGYWLIVVVIFIALIVAYNFWWVRSPVRQLQSDKVKLKIPVLGSILRRRVVSQFLRTFAMLIRSGVSMMATLDLCKNSVANRAYVGVVQDMRDSVERGEGLEGPLRDAEKQGYLSGVVVDMMLTGEETGSLERVADQVASTYEEEIEIAVDGLTETITPAFVVVMGFIVGSIVLGMFLPLITMIETISSGAL
jgi:type IV pilus assembly protein PilC